jgi:hypothetical protein
MKDETRYNLWTIFVEEYKEYFKSDNEVWYENFEELKIFINKNKKRPSEDAKTETEKKLGKWLTHQCMYHKKKEYGMNDENRYNLWSSFLDEYKEYFKSDYDIWYENFQELKIYINEHKKKPSLSSQNTSEKKLGSWKNTQNKNYKKKKKV